MTRVPNRSRNVTYRVASPPSEPAKPVKPARKDWPDILAGAGIVAFGLPVISFLPAIRVPVVVEHISWSCVERYGLSTERCGYGYSAISGRYDPYSSEEEETVECATTGTDSKAVCPEATCSSRDEDRRGYISGTVQFREAHGTQTFGEDYFGNNPRDRHLHESCTAYYNIYGSRTYVLCP